MGNIFGEKLIKQRKPQRDNKKPNIAEKLLYLMEMFKV